MIWGRGYKKRDKRQKRKNRERNAKSLSRIKNRAE